MDEANIDELNQQVNAIVDKVPRAENWETYCLKRGLTPERVNEIIQLAVGRRKPTSVSQPNNTATSIVRFGFQLFDRAGRLSTDHITFRRAAALTRLIGSALMVVSNAVEGKLFHEEASIPKDR